MNLNTTADTDAGTSAPPSPTGVDFTTSAPVATPEFTSLVPDEYKNTEWVQNIGKTEKPVYEMFKKVDNLEKMIGSRPAIPTPESTPEQKAAFYKAIGVPEKPEDYTYTPPQYEEIDKPVGEILDKIRNSPIFDGVKQVAHEQGIPAPAFQKLVEKYEALQIAHARDQIIANYQAQEDMAAQMQRLGEQYYGDKFTSICARGHELLKSTVPPQVMHLLEKVPGEHLAVFAMALDGLDKKYIRSDGRISGDGNYTGGMNIEQIREEMGKVMGDPRYGTPNGEMLNTRMAELRENLKRLTGG